LVIERLAVTGGVRVSVSVAVLLAVLGSVTPPGAATEAVLVKEPVAAGLIVPVAVKVTLPPEGSVTAWLMLPLPLAVHVPPAVPRHVQVTPVRAVGNVSVTVAPVAVLGPAY
jgi:hypothetical protein